MTTRTAEREHFLAGNITTAIEGGTGYWAAVLKYRWEGLDDRDVFAEIVAEDELDELYRELGRKVKRSELEERGLVKRIDIDTIAKGIRKITSGEVKVRPDIVEAIRRDDRENDGGNIDADGADVIVQAALFGEVVYG